MRIPRVPHVPVRAHCARRWTRTDGAHVSRCPKSIVAPDTTAFGDSCARKCLGSAFSACSIPSAHWVFPDFAGRKFRFHDVELGGLVDYARQALAIDERRRVFAPSVWTKAPSRGSMRRSEPVSSLWTPTLSRSGSTGSHSDVGGGYEEHALSDQPLAWMIAEAESAGQRDSSKPSAGRFAVESEHLRTVAKPLNAHDSLSRWYRLLNAVGWATERFRSSSVVIGRSFGGRRVLEMPNDARD